MYSFAIVLVEHTNTPTTDLKPQHKIHTNPTQSLEFEVWDDQSGSAAFDDIMLGKGEMVS